MPSILPPKVSEATFNQALGAFRSAVGREWVLDTDSDRETYLDSYALGEGREHLPSAAVAPASVEEVQAILRHANAFKVPLWPISRGKNLGYGEAAPVMPGTVILDLGRMNRILELDPKLAYVRLEPGVSFFDLYNHLRDEKIPLWMSTPGNAWGSVIGNALERGFGYTPYGDHAEMLCGMEVVLPQGDIVRTGMGAIAGGKAWNFYKYGLGPGWDQMFVQSNFGIITQCGLWLQPEPEMTAKVRLHLPKFEDIGWAIDALAELRRRNVIEHNIICGNYLHDAAVFSQRKDWYQGDGAIPDSVSEKIIAEYKTGWWSAGLSLHGYEGTVKSHMDVIRRTFEPRLGRELEFVTWKQGDPIEQSARGIPSVLALQIVNWMGGRGGHIGFSPAMPPRGDLAFAQASDMKKHFEAARLDYYTSFTIGRRHINNINLIIYNRDDANMVSRAKSLFNTLLTAAAERGYAEYRTHIDFMDAVAGRMDFNNHAMGRLNNRVKDLLDPNGIIAPGKNGIYGGRWA